MTRLAALCSSLLVIGIVGCSSPEEVGICPVLGPGDLVITELRANQRDTVGQYVELYNATATSQELRGLQLLIGAVDEYDEPDGRKQYGFILVRRPLAVASGERVVLGGALPGSADPAIDYTWQPDLLTSGEPRQLPDGDGDVQLIGCDGVVLDRVVWADLPSIGTYSLGLVPPTAAGNDDAAAWCIDPAIPGTPGEANIACP